MGEREIGREGGIYIEGPTTLERVYLFQGNHTLRGHVESSDGSSDCLGGVLLASPSSLCLWDAHVSSTICPPSPAWRGPSSPSFVQTWLWCTLYVMYCVGVYVCMCLCVGVCVLVCFCDGVCVCVLCWYVLVPMWLSLGVYVGVFLIVCRCVFCMLVSMCWCVCCCVLVRVWLHVYVCVGVVVCWCVCIISSSSDSSSVLMAPSKHTHTHSIQTYHNNNDDN